ncbi:hypothetical protein AVEN_231146-1 [Araneus ventricosus]|uniref:Tc1-like transposase DDE domain-containing protein n=1 Tax=Araneus ventricosus TaxID=182803 RepID=A0A4Y2USJ6_ARAVE|nr:hypothetical protein AVEN_41355-1 [Araneus ventricosus]GBO15118.1 hypothetical protein AVEN_187233-1 [Araneus ventricosus]GBO15172.1 hypothetical protein AVEN_40173-1 [Araneus ventricosus]GBO15173.1 hypothetical protein AVEN_231146-1 [Araneus ventricosus]
MVWGAISYDSRSTLVVIPNTLNANLYVSLVIQPVVLPFMRSIQGGILQQDNARPHTAAVSQRALQGVDILHWPARSPDLSPIEHAWDDTTHARTTTPASFTTSINRPCTYRSSATGMELHSTN